ncbi:MAG: hypothetical protein ACSNEK_03680 [Parachlamydiaceae bacterium]
MLISNAFKFNLTRYPVTGIVSKVLIILSINKESFAIKEWGISSPIGYKQRVFPALNPD